jgi:hypothetical protein
VTETSKFVLKVVIALSWIVYVEEADLAVLGETVEDATVKLTCALRRFINPKKNIQTRKMFISFIRLV